MAKLKNNKSAFPGQRSHLILLIVVFALVFGVTGVRQQRSSSALDLQYTAPTVTLEAETLTLRPGASVVSETGASGGKVLVISADNPAQLTATVNLPFRTTDLLIRARKIDCSVSNPILRVRLTTPTNTTPNGIFNNRVSNTSYEVLHKYRENLDPGISTISVDPQTVGGTTTSTCPTKLYIDYLQFVGPKVYTNIPPPPKGNIGHATIVVSPGTVRPGQTAFIYGDFGTDDSLLSELKMGCLGRPNSTNTHVSQNCRSVGEWQLVNSKTIAFTVPTEPGKARTGNVAIKKVIGNHTGSVWVTHTPLIVTQH